MGASYSLVSRFVSEEENKRSFKCEGERLMLKEWLFPWESQIMIDHPLAMPVFMGMLSLLLSILSWIRESKCKNKK